MRALSKDELVREFLGDKSIEQVIAEMHASDQRDREVDGLMPTLIRTHPDQWVRIKDGRVVEAWIDWEQLRSDLEPRGGLRDGSVLTFVEATPRILLL